MLHPDPDRFWQFTAVRLEEKRTETGLEKVKWPLGQFPTVDKISRIDKGQFLCTDWETRLFEVQTFFIYRVFQRLTLKFSTV
jgi:hypothetical protein